MKTSFLGKGVPNTLCGEGCPAKVSPDLLPDANMAADLYEVEVGSGLTRESIFGSDPFPSEEARCRAAQQFNQSWPNMATLLHSAVNNNYTPLQSAVLQLIDITRHHTA